MSQSARIDAAHVWSRRPSGLLLFLLATLVVSLLISVSGVLLKERIVRALPGAIEAAGPPSGITRFLSSGIDSYMPMRLVLRIHESPAGDRIFETLKAFQLNEDTSLAGDLSEFQNTKKFQYPLTSLLPLLLLDRLGIGDIRSFNLINLGAYLLTIVATGWLAVLLFGKRRSAYPRNAQATERDNLLIFLAASAFGVAFHPSFMALGLGNIQLWINCLFAFACVAWAAGRYALAGALIALATMIKPQLGALLLWAILWRQWAFCLGFAIVAAPLGIVALVYFGLHNNLAYLDVLSAISRHGERLFRNESINGIAHRLVDRSVDGVLTWDSDYYAPYRLSVYLATLVGAVIFLALAVAPAFLSGRKAPNLADFSVASICFTIGSPIVWSFHYGVLLPIFVVALRYAMNERNAARRSVLIGLLGLATLMLSTYAPFLRLLTEAPWNILANVHLFGALIVMVVLIISARLFAGAGMADAAGRPRLSAAL